MLINGVIACSINLVRALAQDSTKQRSPWSRGPAVYFACEEITGKNRWRNIPSGQIRQVLVAPSFKSHEIC